VPVRAGTPGVPHPRILKAGPPVYPLIAQSARVSGNVIIETVIDTTGRVAATTVTRSIPLLDAAAIEAVRSWRFEPPVADGRPSRFLTTVTIHFQLADASAPLPMSGSKASGSGMPADFAVVYAPKCPIVATLSTATHDLEAVYRALSVSGHLTRTEGLRVWPEPLTPPTATTSNDGVEMTIAGRAPEVDCSGRPDTPVYRLHVRSEGTWRQLWPPLVPALLPSDYQKQLDGPLSLIRRIVEGK
jgi:TonB family protein